MKTSRFTDSQIMAILKQNETGSSVPDLCREHGDSDTSGLVNGLDERLVKRRAFGSHV